MGQGQSSECCDCSEKEPKVTLKGVASGLADGIYKNVVVMCGAGISTAAGVPDFRSPSVGLYFKLKKIEGLPYPEAVFDGNFFYKNPVPFYHLVREIYPSRLEPTLTHRFFKLLSDKGCLRRVFTQNIDALEYLPGLDSSRVVEAHGTFQRSYCTECGKTYDLEWLKDKIFNPSDQSGVPKCVSCGGVVRPDVVLFGEAMPRVFWSRASTDFPVCDLLIVMGTSLAVAPFNTLVGRTKSGVPRIYINRTKPGAAGGFLSRLMCLGADVRFNRNADLIVQEDCDKVVREICKINGWENELDNLPYSILEA